MKVCPECKSRYDDNQGSCPKDGTRLVAHRSGDDEGEVAPHDSTAVVDLEALAEQRRSRRSAMAADDEAIDADDPEKTPPPTESEQGDPEATGTMKIAIKPKGQKGTRGRGTRGAALQRDDDRASEHTAQSHRDMSATSIDGQPTNHDEDGAFEERMTDLQHESRALPTDGVRPPRLPTAMRASRAPLSPGTAALLVVLAVGALGVGIFMIARSHAVLTVTTVPPGALVTIDGKPAGMATLQKRVSVGSHSIELELEGYEPFKEVVQVPVGGLPFLQPLRTKGPPIPPPPTKEQRAADLQAAIEKLLNGRDTTAATSKLDELRGLMPEDPHVGVFDARVAQLEKDRAKERAGSEGGKRALARSTYDEGKRLYENGTTAEARAKLQKAIELDPKYADPHRILARIYNRADDVPRTRYHLSRYISLGGPDEDFKVREWLKAHPE